MIPPTDPPIPSEESIDWLAEFRQRVTAERWDKIVSKLIERAEGGDMKAIEIVERAVIAKERSDPNEKKYKTIRLVLATPKPRPQ